MVQFNKRPTVADIRAMKARGEKISMLYVTTLEEAAAADAAGIHMLSIESRFFSAEMRAAAGKCFVQVGLPFGPYGGLATAEDYLRTAFKYMAMGGDCFYCAASLDIQKVLCENHVPIVAHVGLIPSYITWTGWRAVGKTAVLGMREKGGRTKAGVIPNTSANTLHRAVHGHVEPGSTLHTDEHGGYLGLDGLFYTHESINHGSGEYVRDGVHTNSIESVWAVMKRGLHGVYHHASPKHLDRYVSEFTFRLNDGDVARHTLDRIASLLFAANGKRLTYKALIA